MRFAEGGRVPVRGDQVLPIPGGDDLKIERLGHYPSLAERIIRSAMHIVATLLMILVGVLIVLFLVASATFVDRLNDTAPEPAVTGCPFGDLECGG